MEIARGEIWQHGKRRNGDGIGNKANFILNTIQPVSIKLVCFSFFRLASFHFIFVLESLLWMKCVVCFNLFCLRTQI